MTKTPIAYIVFNRPNHVRETFGVIRAQRPATLFIIADGPRPGHPTDASRCQEVRALLEQVDWPCEVYRNYADTNLGLKRRVSSGLDWVFQHADRAIILEDDCLPNPDFFDFCDLMLDRYASDERVSVVTGDNFQDGRKRGNASYYFSKYNHCWGWATWRRSWQLYDGGLSFWPEWENSNAWMTLLPDPVERRYWSEIFNRVKRNQVDSWAYPWTASVWYRGGLTVTPNVNLVTNIGFDADGTHTLVDEHHGGLKSERLGQMKHPSEVKQDERADRYVFNHTFGGNTLRWWAPLLRKPRAWANGLSRRIKRLSAPL